MKSRSTLILVLVALAVAGIVAWDFHKGTTTEEAAQKRRKVVELDVPSVTKVELARTNQTIVIEKQGEAWQIVEPLKTKADYSAVRAILDELEFAERERTLSAKDLDGVNLAEFGLEPPRLTLTITGKDGPVTVLLGGESPTKESVYLQVVGKPNVYVVAHSVQDRLNQSLPDLRDRSVLDFLANDVARFELKSAERVIELAKTDGRWRILQPLNARANQTKVSELLNDLSLLRVQNFVSDDPQDVVTYRLNEPVREVSIWKNGEADAATLLIGQPVSNDVANVYAKRKGGDAIFTINNTSLSKLELQPNDLRDSNVVDFSPADVHGLVVQRGANQIALARTNGTWQITAPFRGPAEESEVSALLSRLTGLSIQEFTADVAGDLETYGLSVPSIIVGFDGAGTNSLAQLLIGAPDASHSVQYVKRASEPFVYGVAPDVAGWLPIDPWTLRAKRVAQLPANEVRRLELERGDQRTVLERGADRQWKLVEPAQGVLDTDALTAWLNVFTDLRAEKFFEPAAHPSLTGALTATVAIDDKTYVLTVAAADEAGHSLASWNDPHLVCTLSAPTVQTLQKELVKPAP
jgi:hypothetical protein